MAVDPDYFKVFGIPLLAGRTMDERDTLQSTRVAVINETLARHFFAAQDPIGKRILIGGPRPNAPWLTIVGVVKDVRMTGPTHRTLPLIYTSTDQSPSMFAFLAVRSRGLVGGLPALMAHAVGNVDAEVPLSDLRTMEQRFWASTSRPRFHTSMLGTFAAIALALALAGIAGFVAYGVAQRNKEIGVRMAIGASPKDVLRLMVRDGMIPVLIGAGIGIVASAHLSDLLKTLLFETEPLDPVAYVSAAGAFMVVSLAACAIAARRAVKVNPVIALRTET
jgi:ABC-type antimicrobial peptide transport system permease subunit